MAEPVLFLPGLLCDDRLWRDQVAGLAGLAHGVVADLTQDDSLDAMAGRALAAVPGRFALCGLSMGGYVAMALMRLAPERVTRLCLMDTSARADTPEQARRRRLLMSTSAGHRFRGVTPRLLPSLLHPDRVGDAVLGDEVAAMAERVGHDAFLRQQTAILNRSDSRAHLPAIGVPTLVAVGEGDQLTPPERAAEIAALIPGASLERIEGAGHLPPMETPERVTAMLRAWLAGPSGGA
ncbi:MAG: alpha/beta hydrolase [Acetobacteraceae bacterium SCN 69-10]|nr:MAG: alpha/beta hydrolase [Acetobacteraceae bacterium SCN 69-10]OJY70186.1 MAG: alpha/beta hydrolase [Rhodospirillales bacterium 70-18]